MKKNKKHWKKQAKAWEKIAGIESESANEWAYTAFTQADQINELEEDLHAAFLDLEVESTLVKESYDAYSDLDKQYIEAIEKAEKLTVALEAAKKELSILRQYNIGKKPYYNTTTTGTALTNNWANWAIKQYNIPVGIDPAIKRVVEESATLPTTSKRRWWRRNK